ncbi:Protein PIH1D3 [Acanthosepion pharaonis]|uniref:Protein PIH1D3 n=1 Tax=Acanthosepion pharaonis TaxID=158019 RepID=A0A812ESU7_ACAPH|nr:Protein PIH1D3 [Sepia pharaonis]
MVTKFTRTSILEAINFGKNIFYRFYKMSFSVADIRSLANLLKQPEEDSDSDGEQLYQGSASLGPGNIGETKKQEKPTFKKDLSQSKDIWHPEEINAGSEFDSLSDPRPQPEYEILYKQSVTTEDIFLQMGNKTPNTSSCENMIIKIKLPNTEMKNITLDVKSIFLDVRTPKYKLGLHLPNPVKEQESTAQWDSDQESLIVTLKLNREFDFLNY